MYMPAIDRSRTIAGAVEAGTVNTGDELEIVGGDQRGKNMMTTCTGEVSSSF